MTLALSCIYVAYGVTVIREGAKAFYEQEYEKLRLYVCIAFSICHYLSRDGVLMSNRFCPLCKRMQQVERFEIKTWDIETGMNTLQELKVCFDCRHDEMNEEEEK